MPGKELELSTQDQKNKYGHLGNEILFPMATNPNNTQGQIEGATAILEDRGNVITDDGNLQKTRTTQQTDVNGIHHELIEVVENGKMISRTVDGVAITGNIVQF